MDQNWGFLYGMCIDLFGLNGRIDGRFPLGCSVFLALAKTNCSTHAGISRAEGSSLCLTSPWAEPLRAVLGRMPVMQDWRMVVASQPQSCRLRWPGLKVMVRRPGSRVWRAELQGSWHLCLHASSPSLPLPTPCPGPCRLCQGTSLLREPSCCFSPFPLLLLGPVALALGLASGPQLWPGIVQ